MNSNYDTLQYDNKTRDELLENVVIEKTTFEDIYEVIRIVAHTFEIDDYSQINHHVFNLVEEELANSKADFDQSVKLVDKRDGKIYGVIVYSHFPIQKGSPILEEESTRMIGEYLMGFSQINGFAFIIDKRLRGTGLDKKMIMYNYKWLETFDFIWAATDIDSKTNEYWKRWGGLEILTTDEASFYIKNMSKKNMDDVFILKMLSEKKKRDEKDSNNREKRENSY